MWKEKEADVVFEEVRDSKAEGKEKKSFEDPSLVRILSNQIKPFDLRY